MINKVEIVFLIDFLKFVFDSEWQKMEEKVNLIEGAKSKWE